MDKAQRMDPPKLLSARGPLHPLQHPTLTRPASPNSLHVDHIPTSPILAQWPNFTTPAHGPAKAYGPSSGQHMDLSLATGPATHAPFQPTHMDRTAWARASSLSSRGPWTMDQRFFSKFTRTTHTNSSTSALSHVDGKFPIRASLQLYLKSFKQPEREFNSHSAISVLGAKGRISIENSVKGQFGENLPKTALLEQRMRKGF
ncbi:uncharacterized protein LOC122723732 [Manihot esculenta]|uniref:uncharacterized protein LOC122723732 n=1 Tax=Manihot esculenta TaxID=3983 RepID=UPI001CC426EC|nr:uncharacterized protein LOC122723732 [Manihot esculenta]